MLTTWKIKHSAPDEIPRVPGPKILDALVNDRKEWQISRKTLLAKYDFRKNGGHCLPHFAPLFVGRPETVFFHFYMHKIYEGDSQENRYD